MAQGLKNKRNRHRNSDSFGDKFLTFILLPLRLFLYYFLFQFVFRIVFKYGHKLKFDKNGKKLPKRNFLVLGNHVTDWDGLYINTYFNRFIYFIVHDEIFKYRFRKVIAYNLLGQIKRGKAKNDIGPLRKLIELRDSGKCIGIFPEGDISYTGKSLEIDRSIAKLCKILDMPVVLTRVDGATLQRPRWSYEVRRKKIKMTVTDIISCEDLKDLDCDRLYGRICEGITYDDNEYQKANSGKIKAKNPAEKLELALFLCPDCKSVHTMASEKDRFYCKKCGYEVKLNEYSAFELVKGKNLYQNIKDWDAFQRSCAAEIIGRSIKENKEIISLENFSYNKVSEGDFFYAPQKTGALFLNASRIRFTSNDNNFEEIFDLKDIKDLYIQFKGAVEFTKGGYRYRFISRNGQHYGYSFECFITAVLKNNKELKING